MSQLADFLETHKRELLERWIARVDASIAKDSSSRRELADHMPVFVDQVIAALRDPPPHRDFAPSPPGREHGAQRFRLGFEIEDVVREYGMLSHTLLDLLESDLVPVPLSEVRILTDQVTADTAEATAEYARRMTGAAAGSRQETETLKGQLETTLLSIGDGVLATDAQGRITFMNPVAEALTGWTSAQARQKPVGEVFHIIDERTRKLTPSPVDRVLRDGVVAALANHTLLLRRDGVEIPIDDSAAPIRDEKGRMSGVVLVFRDVSEKKKLEREAAAERQKLHAVLELTPVAICILEGPGHVFSFVNPAYRAFASGRDLLGKPLLEALPELRGHGFDTRLDRVMATGEPYFGNELPSKTRHAGEMIVNFVYTPMRDAAGKVSGVLVSVVDVTEQVRSRKRVEVLVAQLQLSEERLRRVVDASGAGSWELDAVTGKITADARHEALTYNPTQITDRLEARISLIHPDDRELLAGAFRQVTAGENGGRMLVQFRTGREGVPVRWVEARGQAFKGADGKVVRVVGTSIDITARKEAEAAIASEREKLATIIRESPAAMCLWRGPDFVFELANERFEQVFGNRRLVGKTLAEGLPELTDQAFPALLKRVFETGEPFVGHEVLARIASREGGPLADHYYDFTYLRVNDAAGNPYGVYDHSVDVTERVVNRRNLEQLLAAFRSSEASFRTLAEAIPQQVWTALPGGALDFVNQRVVDYFAVPREQILGAGWQDVLHPDDLPNSAKKWLHSLATGEQYETEFRLRRADGTYRWHLGRALASRDAQGRIVKWFGTNTDVDEAKKFREELEKRTDFEQHLLGIVSHDLRNPLAAILLSAATLLQTEDQNERTTRIARRIHSSAERSGRMIRDLLDFTQARLGSGIPLQRKPADLHALTSAALEEIELVAPDRVELRRTGDAQGFWDVDRLSQVVTNLVSNALKYSPPGTPVKVQVQGGDDAAELSVQNLGAPIPPERLGKIFEPLQRASDQIDRNDRSVGLGLYIVDSIVRAHGGTVRVESTAAAGTTFTVRLPRRT